MFSSEKLNLQVGDTAMKQFLYIFVLFHHPCEQHGKKKTHEGLQKPYD